MGEKASVSLARVLSRKWQKEGKRGEAVFGRSRTDSVQNSRGHESSCEGCERTSCACGHHRGCPGACSDRPQDPRTPSGGGTLPCLMHTREGRRVGRQAHTPVGGAPWVSPALLSFPPIGRFEIGQE